MEHTKIGHSQRKEGNDDEDVAAILSEFQVSAAAAQGGRRYMEDRLHVEVGRTPTGELHFIFAAIYDGHGGIQASDYVSRHLFANIVSNQNFFSEDDQEILEAIRIGFLRTHMNMQKVAEKWPPTSSGFPCTAGTTATCVFLRNGKLYTGHVGDSSIFLANFMEDAAGYNDAKLTEDHKPDDHSERLRIEKAGGAVAAKSGIVRVIWKRPIRGHRGPIRRSTSTENIPFLAVARSLGDFWSLNPDNNQYVVSPEPDVDVFRLKKTDNFLVLASDGLTNVVPVRSIIQILRDIDANNKQPENRAMKKEQQHIPVNHAHALLQNAFKKWGTLRADNISIICIKLDADEIPQGHTCIGEEDPDMDICHQLTEHPFSIIQINKTDTLPLNTAPIRHFYGGSLDKGVNLQAIRFGRAINGNSTNSSRQRTTSAGQEYFTGPGFVVPDMPPAIDNDWVSGSSKSSLLSPSYGGNNGIDYCECESDAEEGKNGAEKGGGTEAELVAQKERKKRQEVGEEGSHTLNGGSPGKFDQMGKRLDKEKGMTSTKGIQRNEPEGEETNLKGPFNRTGVKRRWQANEDDGYIRHMPNTMVATISSGASSIRKKVCLEHEEQQEEGMRPPPAKRSKLQSVFNFFTNLFKW